MGAQMRVYRQRIRSVQATKKITRAMELIAASRVVKARQRVVESGPYTHALTKALSALAEYSNEAHALITEKSEIKRAAVLVIAGDRGLSGGYNSSVIKESEQLVRKLQEEGKEVAVYLCGQRAMISTSSATATSSPRGTASPTRRSSTTPRRLPTG